MRTELTLAVLALVLATLAQIWVNVAHPCRRWEKHWVPAVLVPYPMDDQGNVAWVQEHGGVEDVCVERP